MKKEDVMLKNKTLYHLCIEMIALVQQAVWCLILTSQETEARPGCAAGRPAVQIGLMRWALWNTTHL